MVRVEIKQSCLSTMLQIFIPPTFPELLLMHQTSVLYYVRVYAAKNIKLS